jgi:hypothetical protein
MALDHSGFAMEPDVGALVTELRDLYFGSGIELMLRVGELILERLYGGDAERWRSRSRKDVSFRRLEKHPGLPFKAAMLSRAVSIYVLSQRRPDLLQLKNVSQTHLQEVLGLEPELQDRLLARVEDEKWSVRRLRDEVVENLPTTIRRAGRPRAQQPSKQLRHLRAIADGRLLVIDSANAAVLQFREAQDLLDVARRLCQQAEQAARVLTAHLDFLERSRGEASTQTRRPSGILPVAPPATAGGPKAAPSDAIAPTVARAARR